MRIVDLLPPCCSKSFAGIIMTEKTKDKKRVLRPVQHGTTALNPEQWIDLYADPLFAYARMRVRDHQQAEDLVQESFLSAWKARHSFNGNDERVWLFAICKNKIIDYYRSAGAGVSISLDYYFDDDDHWTAGAAPKPWKSMEPHEHHSSAPDQVKHMDKLDFYRILDACRNKLNSPQYAVFTLKYLDQLETKEICHKMNITIQNYWVLVHRAKLQLRECLELNWINLK
ncbi:MAG: sigma-70 family RNA polymerase sigma factor [Chitinophagaceae bacterium]|nr:MAG: sigma-70 family RNA polymerase sigma factor [Chitinophagaceae bacterium]